MSGVTPLAEFSGGDFTIFKWPPKCAKYRYEI